MALQRRVMNTVPFGKEITGKFESIYERTCESAYESTCESILAIEALLSNAKRLACELNS